jgi:hypothetical protein
MLQSTPLLLLLALVSAPLQAASDGLPVPYRATYSLTVKSLRVGTAEISLEQQADLRYAFEDRITPVGLGTLLRRGGIVERSVWAMKDGQFQSVEYRYKAQGGKKPHEAIMEFHWDKGQVDGTSTEEGAWTLPIHPGTVDRLLTLICLRRDLAAAPGAKNDVFHYEVADRGKIKVFDVTAKGPEHIVTPLGEFDTLRYDRTLVDSDRYDVLWLAPSLGYLPVRFDHHEKADSVTSALLLEYAPAPATPATAATATPPSPPPPPAASPAPASPAALK